MNKKAIKHEIEKAAKESGCSEIEIISAMQGTLAKIGDEKSIGILHKIKMEYFAKQNPALI